MINDPSLLAAYKAGEKEAFLKLYNKHAIPLRKFLQGGFSFSSQGKMCRFRGTDGSMDVESIIQETFLRAFGATTRTNYDGERPFQTYLFSIAKNLVLRECHHRDRLIAMEKIKEISDKNPGTPFCSSPNYGLSPETLAQDKQLEKLTMEFIDDLNEEEKLFFMNRFAQEITQEATAEIMNTTRARIKLLEKNLRKRFLDLLRKHGYLLGRELKPRWKRLSECRAA